MPAKTLLPRISFTPTSACHPPRTHSKPITSAPQTGSLQVALSKTLRLPASDPCPWLIWPERFRYSPRTYQIEAPIYNAPQFPTSFSFLMVTLPVVSDVTFQAGIESLHGGTTVNFPAPIAFHPGLFDSWNYFGPISTLGGSLSFSPAQSLSLFQNSAALLYIEDLGGDVAIGLPPYTLNQDIYASVGGGPISVGAFATSMSPAAQAPVPEPASALLLLSAILTLSIGAAWRRRMRLRYRAGI